MAQKLIRDIPDETMIEIEARATEAHKSAEAWIRDLLIKVAAEPIVRERYALRFYADEGPAKGLIRRFSDDPNGVGGGSEGLTMKQMQAVKHAQDLIRRNRPGDREEAIYLLKSHFNNVFEVPV